MPDKKTLAPELIALVHHIELNKAGWWEIAIQKLLLTALHPQDADKLTMTPTEIKETLKNRYTVDLKDSAIIEQLSILVTNGDVYETEVGKFKASEKAIKACEAEISEAVALEDSVKKHFKEILLKHCPTIDSDHSWAIFIERFLVPLVNQMGANTYNLLTGSENFGQLPQVSEFVECFEPELADGIDNFLKEFLDPKNAPLRRFVLRTMTASFVVRAGGLSKSTVQRLSQSAEEFKTTLFCDSNVLFSLLGLHENPADESSRTLLRLIHRLSNSMPIELRVLPPTLDEMKRALKASQEAVIDMRISPSLLQPAINAGLKGITVKYLALLAERKGPVAPADYFEPYLRNLVTILRDNGIELFNADLTKYRLKQDVIDDLLVQMEFEKKKYGQNAKNYERLEHDIAMWYFVNDKRPPRPDSPIDAKYWIVTADYRLLGYDAYKHRNMVSEIPICLHPTAVVQLLQFWVPMDSDFEAALFSAIQLPTVLVPFDGDAEEVSLKILNALSTFANISDLPPDTTTRILLNDALRQKLALEKEVTKQIDLVREALIEENQEANKRVRAEIAKNRRIEQQSQGLEVQLANIAQDVTLLKSNLDQALERERAAKEAEGSALARERAAGEDLERLRNKIRTREIESQRKRDRNLRIAFSVFYLGTLVIMVGAAFRLHPLFIRHVVAASGATAFAFLLWAFIFAWWGIKSDAIKDWQLFNQVLKAKRWLLLAIIGGIAGNAAWAVIGRASASNKVTARPSTSLHDSVSALPAGHIQAVTPTSRTKGSTPGSKQGSK